VLLAILAAGLIVVIVLLARRGGGGVQVDERRRQLEAAVATWAAQGWAIENQTGDSTVLAAVTTRCSTRPPQRLEHAPRVRTGRDR
jgi:hypothetical protein